MTRKNNHAEANKQTAQALFRQNRLHEAKRVYTAISCVDRSDAESWVMLGVINRKLGLFRESEESCRCALALQPKLAQAHQVLGTALQCQGDITQALNCYRKAIELKPDLAEAHFLLGNALREGGLLDEAVACYRKAVGLDQNFLAALSNLGAVLMIQGQYDQALQYFNRALDINPASPQVLCNVATLLERRGRMDEASDSYQRALAITPDFVDAIAGLAAIKEKMSLMDEARDLVARGLGLAPDNTSLLTTAANIARRDGRLQEAVELLERVLRNATPIERGALYLDLGKLYDQIGEADRAFYCFTEGNRITESLLPKDYDRHTYSRKIDKLSSYLTEKLRFVKPYPMTSDQERSPVFLIGFLRSGTTLLDQMLDSHPRVQTLSEKPTVQVLIQACLERTKGLPDKLIELTNDEVRELREIYFDAVKQHIDFKSSMVLVDKMPLNTIVAHIIWRIFPDAKFLLAIRHPCDVCLSCFMQNIAIDNSLTTFSTLESTALFYARVMGLWQQYVRILPINYHRVRYEDLVANFEQEARHLLDYIGVGWDDAVLGYSEHAKKRIISTPSYHQVTQPIYQYAKFRWKRYARHFEPVMDQLMPYIKYFGYSETDVDAL